MNGYQDTDYNRNIKIPRTFGGFLVDIYDFKILNLYFLKSHDRMKSRNIDLWVFLIYNLDCFLLNCI